jgi:hypothetical protein
LLLLNVQRRKFHGSVPVFEEILNERSSYSHQAVHNEGSQKDNDEKNHDGGKIDSPEAEWEFSTESGRAPVR